MIRSAWKRAFRHYVYVISYQGMQIPGKWLPGTSQQSNIYICENRNCGKISLLGLYDDDDDDVVFLQVSSFLFFSQDFSDVHSPAIITQWTLQSEGLSSPSPPIAPTYLSHTGSVSYDKLLNPLSWARTLIDDDVDDDDVSLFAVHAGQGVWTAIGYVFFVCSALWSTYIMSTAAVYVSDLVVRQLFFLQTTGDKQRCKLRHIRKLNGKYGTYPVDPFY